MNNTKAVEPKTLLSDFIYDELNNKPVKTKSGKGYMLYDVSETIDIARLTSLVSAVNSLWTASYFEPTYDKGNKTRAASVYFGEKQNKNEVERDSFLASI